MPSSEIDPAAAFRNVALARHQRHQCQHAALALVVGAHHHGDVLHRDDQDQRPGDQRQDAQDILRRQADTGVFAEALLDRVERLVPISPKTTPSAASVSAGRALIAGGLPRRIVGRHACRLSPVAPLGSRIDPTAGIPRRCSFEM